MLDINVITLRYNCNFPLPSTPTICVLLQMTFTHRYFIMKLLLNFVMIQHIYYRPIYMIIIIRRRKTEMLKSRDLISN